MGSSGPNGSLDKPDRAITHEDEDEDEDEDRIAI